VSCNIHYILSEPEIALSRLITIIFHSLLHLGGELFVLLSLKDKISEEQIKVKFFLVCRHSTLEMSFIDNNFLLIQS
jgi:uncharacterized membrane protein YciS (DUF1049 family)